MKDFSGLNLKIRFKNKTFVSALIGILGLIASKIALDFFNLDISQQVTSILEIGEYVLIALAMIGVLSDPTVEGFGDSDYSKEKEVPSKKTDKPNVSK